MQIRYHLHNFTVLTYYLPTLLVMIKVNEWTVQLHHHAAKKNAPQRQQQPCTTAPVHGWHTQNWPEAIAVHMVMRLSTTCSSKRQHAALEKAAHHASVRLHRLAPHCCQLSRRLLAYRQSPSTAWLLLPVQLLQLVLLVLTPVLVLTARMLCAIDCGAIIVAINIGRLTTRLPLPSAIIISPHSRLL